MSCVIRRQGIRRCGGRYADRAGVAELVRRARLKIGWPSGRAGSSPAPGIANRLSTRAGRRRQPRVTPCGASNHPRSVLAMSASSQLHRPGIIAVTSSLWSSNSSSGRATPRPGSPSQTPRAKRSSPRRGRRDGQTVSATRGQRLRSEAALSCETTTASSAYLLTSHAVPVSPVARRRAEAAIQAQHVIRLTAPRGDPPGATTPAHRYFLPIRTCRSKPNGWLRPGRVVCGRGSAD